MLPVRVPGIVPFNWGGLYAGLNAGGGFGDASGFLVGGQIGYNWQVNQIVFGVETDLQWAGISSTSTLAVGGATLNDKQELEWFGTLRGRVGYAPWERFLPYATAGVAYGSRKASGIATGAFSGSYSATDTSVGWAAGIGLEYAFDPWWSARIEYLHISLGGFTPTYALTGGPLSYGTFDNHIVRAAFNYRVMP
jgi:outer membrane immunogenic protein